MVLLNTLFLKSISVQYKNLLSQIVGFKLAKPSSVRSQRLSSLCQEQLYAGVYLGGLRIERSLPGDEVKKASWGR